MLCATDADYGMPEEDDSFDKSYEEVKPTPRKQDSAQSSSMRKKKRRSMSLTLDASQWTKHLASDVPVADNGRPVSRSLDGVYPGPLTPTSSQDAPMLSITSADGYFKIPFRRILSFSFCKYAKLNTSFIQQQRPIIFTYIPITSTS